MVEGYDELAVRFTHHPPTESQIPKYHKIRATAAVLAREVVDLVPACRERSLALTKLEEVVMWANAGIARR